MHPELFENARSFLHFAPEYGLQQKFRQISGLRYVTADLDAEGVDLQLDLTALAVSDRAFDGILCSHVLEHVEDDRAAMSELRRVLAENGWLIVLVPLDLSREETYEDPNISSPEDRQREFWQHDHVRLYTTDIGKRLEEAGFDVTVVKPLDEFGKSKTEQSGILLADYLFLCRPRGR